MDDTDQLPLIRKKRGSRHRLVVGEDLPPVLVVCNGEEFRCNSWAFEAGFLKLGYWPETRGKIGTRYIAVSTIKDLRIERPMEMTPAVVSGAIAGETPHPQEAMGPVMYTNPIAQAARDQKAFQAKAIPDPMGVRPMSRIVDEEGKVAIVEAGIS